MAIEYDGAEFGFGSIDLNYDYKKRTSGFFKKRYYVDRLLSTKLYQAEDRLVLSVEVSKEDYKMFDAKELFNLVNDDTYNKLSKLGF